MNMIEAKNLVNSEGFISTLDMIDIVSKVCTAATA